MDKIITITTDFGNYDEYVASIKGVILSIFPQVKIIDITHNIPPQNVIKAALTLRSTIKFFPSPSYHLVVVDPGVGSRRRIIIIHTLSGKFLVGPDNGVLYPAAKKEGIKEIIEFSNKKYCLPDISDTFHGRDVMGPIIAHLAKGEKIDNFGEKIKEITKIEIDNYTILNKEIIGQIIDIDFFGNIITNISKNIFKEKKINLGSNLKIILNKKQFIIPFLKYFSEVKEGNLFGYIGSKDLFEIAVNNGNASLILKVKIDRKIKIIIE